MPSTGRRPESPTPLSNRPVAPVPVAATSTAAKARWLKTVPLNNPSAPKSVRRILDSSSSPGSIATARSGPRDPAWPHRLRHRYPPKRQHRRRLVFSAQLGGGTLVRSIISGAGQQSCTKNRVPSRQPRPRHAKQHPCAVPARAILRARRHRAAQPAGLLARPSFWATAATARRRTRRDPHRHPRAGSHSPTGRR